MIYNNILSLKFAMDHLFMFIHTVEWHLFQHMHIFIFGPRKIYCTYEGKFN